MSIINPYKNRGRLPVNSDMFFGREEEIKSIDDSLSGDNPQCVSIIGERRIGKSSLAYRMFYKLKKNEDTLLIYLDCDELSDNLYSIDDFFQLITKELSVQLASKPVGKQLQPIVEDEFSSGYSVFRTLIENIGGKGIKSIIFLDEFERLPEYEFADDTFFSNLRAMAYNPDNRLAFVTISRESLKKLTHHSIQSSAFWNIFKTETIGLPDRKSSERLRRYGFERTGFSLTEKEEKKVYYYAGDFPFFIVMVCGFIWESKKYKEELDWNNLETLLFPYYIKLWDNLTPNEKKILKHPGLRAFKDDFSLKEMYTRGLLIKEKNHYLPFSLFFAKSIKRFTVKRTNNLISFILKTLGFKKEQPPISTGMKKIPYGLSDYERIRRENYYYVDKTRYLRKLEETGEYLFFLRPRRFGKSLFLSMLETYYDIARKNEFELFFKGLDIFEDPTEEKNRYMVLKFNFSTVNPAADKVEDSFLNHIKETIIFFLNKYYDYLPRGKERLLEKNDDNKSAFDVLSGLIGLCRNSKRRIYLVIDEYDNFANTILSSIGTYDYGKLTHGVGFLRLFFNKVKEGATGSGAPISRLFVTGVSPLTMDDVTSGFNIGKNITLSEEFNRMLGFTEVDVKKILEYYVAGESGKKPLDFVLGIMEEWYDSYKFSKTAKKRSVYNSDMVLYFIDKYFREEHIPDQLIDNNVRIDYDKVRYLIINDTGEKRSLNGNFSKLNYIVENGKILSKLVESFPAEKLLHPDNFISLLFYHGLLTIDRIEMDKLRLVIPNETVRRLYYEFIKESYGEMNIFNIDLHRYSGLMSDMAFKGKWEPLFEYISSLMRDSMSLRDLITGEKSVQAFLNVYLGLSELYIVNVEREQNMGYADIVMEPFLAKYESIKYSYLLEVKYMAQKEKKSKVKQLRAEAEEQLRTYAMDKKFRKNIKKTTLIKLALVFQGTELVCLEEAGKVIKKGE